MRRCLQAGEQYGCHGVYSDLLRYLIFTTESEKPRLWGSDKRKLLGELVKEFGGSHGHTVIPRPWLDAQVWRCDQEGSHAWDPEERLLTWQECRCCGAYRHRAEPGHEWEIVEVKKEG